MRVLLADDSSIIRDRLMILLSDIPGVDVVSAAASGPEAVDSFERLRPDVTVLDIRMPGGSGIDALRRIKELDASAAVIMLTNYADEQYRTMCESAGADYFLDKSTEFHKIQGAISELMDEFVKRLHRPVRAQPKRG